MRRRRKGNVSKPPFLSDGNRLLVEKRERQAEGCRAREAVEKCYQAPLISYCVFWRLNEDAGGRENRHILSGNCIRVCFPADLHQRQMDICECNREEVKSLIIKK
jgi:hypothetical protein